MTLTNLLTKYLLITYKQHLFLNFAIYLFIIYFFNINIFNKNASIAYCMKHDSTSLGTHSYSSLESPSFYTPKEVELKTENSITANRGETESFFHNPVREEDVKAERKLVAAAEQIVQKQPLPETKETMSTIIQNGIPYQAEPKTPRYTCVCCPALQLQKCCENFTFTFGSNFTGSKPV